MLCAAPGLLRLPWDLTSELVSEERGRECAFRLHADSVAKSHIRAVRSSQLATAPHEKEELGLGRIPWERLPNDHSHRLPNYRSRTRLRLPERFGMRLMR